ncbi:MAG: hypothetical protein AB8B53_05815 [Flavobacteriales bacterium]
MKLVKYILFAVFISLLMFSCKKEDPILCESDPRLPALGSYTMIDSVYFLGEFSDTLSYPFKIILDSLEGDTILLEDMFGPQFILDIKANYNSDSGDFIMVPTPDGNATVTGSGNISGGSMRYTASYSDGGYSFIGNGVKE